MKYFEVVRKSNLTHWDIKQPAFKINSTLIKWTIWSSWAKAKELSEIQKYNCKAILHRGKWYMLLLVT